MGLGEKLQTVYQKVHRKLGMQDGAVTFRKITTTQSTFGQPYTTVSNSDVVISEGIALEYVREKQVTEGSIYQIGDLRLVVPANLLTISQLQDAKILYGSKTYQIVNFRPKDIFSSVPTAWIVTARREVM